MYFTIKEENVFDKYSEIGKKLAILQKKINSEPVYNKKYIKAENEFNTKESF